MLYFPIYLVGKEVLKNPTTNYVGPVQMFFAGSFAGTTSAACRPFQGWSLPLSQRPLM